MIISTPSEIELMSTVATHQLFFGKHLYSSDLVHKPFRVLDADDIAWLKVDYGDNPVKIDTPIGEAVRPDGPNFYSGLLLPDLFSSLDGRSISTLSLSVRSYFKNSNSDIGSSLVLVGDAEFGCTGYHNDFRYSFVEYFYYNHEEHVVHRNRENEDTTFLLVINSNDGSVRFIADNMDVLLPSVYSSDTGIELLLSSSKNSASGIVSLSLYDGDISDYFLSNLKESQA